MGVMRKLTCRLEKLNINEEKSNMICKFIVENKKLTYDEIMEKLLEFNVKDRSVLNQVILFVNINNPELSEKAKIIIDLRFCENNNFKNEKLENLYKKVFKDENKKSMDLEKTITSKSISKSKITKKENDEKKVKIVSEITTKIINGENKEELLKKYGIPVNTFESLKINYLPKNPELFVEYKIYIRKIKPVDCEELEFYIEMVRTLINFLNKILDSEEYEKYFCTPQVSNQRSIISGMINQYSKILILFEDLRVIDNHDISIISDQKIRCLAFEVRNALTGIHYVKTNRVSDSVQEKIYKLYREKVNI